jgi:hypothetical protein
MDTGEAFSIIDDLLSMLKEIEADYGYMGDGDNCECEPEPTDAEAEARFIGQERAGVPSWSVVSASRLRNRLESLVAGNPDRRAELVRIADEAYEAARAARVVVSVGDE